MFWVKWSWYRRCIFCFSGR